MENYGAAAGWIEAVAEPAGPLEPVGDEPWGAVWRVPLAGGRSAWLKQPEAARRFELPLTVMLAARRPHLLPEVLAADEPRGLLLLADAGERLGTGGGPEPWLRILPAYAALQRAEAAHADEHLAIGVPDRRLDRFAALHDDLLARTPQLVSRLDVAALADELAAAGIPETIDHADLHGNNVYLRDGARILDWGDACVSHPFLTFWTSAAHLPELTAADRDRLRDAYLEPWGDPRDLRPVFELAWRLGPYAHAFKELQTLGCVPAWVLPLL